MADFEDDQEGGGTSLDRRRFGKILVSGVGGLSLAAVAGAKDAKLRISSAATATATATSVDVIVVGAGLSGLIAARELQRSNQFDKIVIFEANDRIGGRMDGQTVEAGGKTGYADFGGQWVGPTQTAMLALLEELKLTTFISYEKGQSIQSWDANNGKPAAKTVFNGDVSDLYMGECEGPADFPKDGGRVLATCEPLRFAPCSANAAERRIWLTELLEKISVNVPCDQPWAANGAEALDRETFQQFLNRNGAAGYTQWVPTLASHIGGSGGFEPDEVSLLHMAWTQHVGPQSETPELWLIKGGAGQIPKKLEDEITNKNKSSPVEINRNSPVTRIRNEGDRAAVTVRSGSVETTYSALAVIVAIPPPLRQKIEFPDLPTPYIGFMYGSPMGSMSKVHAIYDRAFWRDQCLSGSATGNLETCEFIADSSSEDGTPGILTSFIAADRNIGLRHASKEEIKKLVLRDYSHFFGDLALTPRDFLYRNWNNEPWTGGAFTSYVPPRVWTRYGKEGWRKPYGAIFWAGTETSERWPGYFDGAIRAGIRSANEVLARLRLPKRPAAPAAACPDRVIKVTS